MTMKKVRAIIKPHKLSKQALALRRVPRLTGVSQLAIEEFEVMVREVE
jgi:nitrogen regulatory protein PII